MITHLQQELDDLRALLGRRQPVEAVALAQRRDLACKGRGGEGAPSFCVRRAGRCGGERMSLHAGTCRRRQARHALLLRRIQGGVRILPRPPRHALERSLQNAGRHPLPPQLRSTPNSHARQPPRTLRTPHLLAAEPLARGDRRPVDARAVARRDVLRRQQVLVDVVRAALCDGGRCLSLQGLRFGVQGGDQEAKDRRERVGRRAAIGTDPAGLAGGSRQQQAAGTLGRRRCCRCRCRCRCCARKQQRSHVASWHRAILAHPWPPPPLRSLNLHCYRPRHPGRPSCSPTAAWLRVPPISPKLKGSFFRPAWLGPV